MPVADGSIIIDTAIDSRSAKGDLDSLMAKFRNTANQAGAIGKKLSNSVEKSFSSFSKASAKLGELDSRIARLKQQIASMKETPVKTSAFSDLEKEIEQTKEKLAKVDAQKQRFLATGGKEDSTAFQRMEYDADQLSAQLDRLLAKKSEMETRGEAYTTPDTTALEEQLNSLMERRVQLANDLGINYDGVKNKISDASGKMAQMQEKERQASDTGDAIKKKFDEVANSIQKAARSSGGLGGGFKNLLKTVLRYGFAIRSTYILVNKLKQFTKEGLKNMALYSSTTNSAISSMLTALNTLKNSLGAAFAPIVETVAPYITSLINMIASAITAVNQFISALLGRSTYTKAIAVQQDYAKSLGGTAAAADKAASGSDKAGKAAKKAAKEQEKFLAGFDEIEKIPDQSDSSSGSSSGGGGGGGGGGSGGGGGTGQALQFVTESIPGLVSDWADMFKKAWEDADFTEIGGIVGAKLRDALDNIPWDGIKTSAKKIAKSIATFINGFFETPGLPQTIADTVTSAIDTAFEFINTFLENTHWDSIGKFLSEAIQEGIHTFPGEQIGRFISDAICAGLDFATGFVDAIEPKTLAEDIKNQLIKVVGAIKVQEIIDKTTELIDKVLTKGSELVEEFFIGLADDITGWALDADGNVDWDKIKEAFKKSVKKAFDLAEPIAELAEKWPDIFPEAFKNVFSKVSLVSQILKLFGPLEDEKTWKKVGAAIETAIKSPFEAGVKGAEAVVGGLRDWIKDIKFEWDPLHGKFGLTLPDKPIEMYVIAKAKELALEDKNVGVTANANKLQDNISKQDKMLDGGTVKVSSLEDKIPAANKTVGNVRATTNSISWEQNANKDLVAQAKTSSINWAPNSQKDLSGVHGKADSVNWAPGSQRDLSVNAKSSDVDVKNKGVTVSAKSKDVGWAKDPNKNLTVSAKSKNIGWAKDPKKNLTVLAHSDTVTLKNNKVKVKAYSDAITGTGGGRGNTKAKGGVLQHGVWHDIPQYAGGSLNAGSMFVAGERGPEVVGHIGGRTEVLNKSQIASAIYQAMVSAMAKMGGYFSQMTSALANIPPAIQTMSMTQPDFVLEIPQMATGTVLPPQATISTRDAQMLRDALVGLTTALQGAQVSGRQGTTQNNITLELPGVGVLGRAMVKYIDGEAKQGRYPLSGYM